MESNSLLDQKIGFKTILDFFGWRSDEYFAPQGLD